MGQLSAITEYIFIYNLKNNGSSYGCAFSFADLRTHTGKEFCTKEYSDDELKITVVPFQQSSVCIFLLPFWLHQTVHRCPRLAPPNSTPTLNASRELNVAMETAWLLTGANFCLFHSDGTIES